MSVLPAPNSLRERMIRPRPGPRWDWRRYARTGWQTALVFLVGMLLIRGYVATFTRFGTTTVTQQVVPGTDRTAEAFAVDVARVWLTFDQDHPDTRKAAVAALVAGDSTLGWDGHGVSVVSAATVEDSDPRPVNGRTQVTVRVTVNGTVRRVVVTVARDKAGHPVLAGVPSFSAAPGVGTIQDDGPLTAVPTDSAATAAATPTVEGFVRAWGAGSSDVGVYSTEGWTPPPGPGGLTVVKIVFQVAPGGTDRAARVAVRWTDGAGRVWPSAYTLTLHTTGSRWTVAGIAPTPSASFADLTP